MSTTQFWCPFLAAMLILVSGQFATAQPEKTSEKPATETPATEKQQSDKQQTEQANETVVRFYPHLNARTARDLRTALPAMIPVDADNAASWVFAEQGEPANASATLMVRHTPEVHAQIKELLAIFQKLELVSTGLFSLDAARVDQAKKLRRKFLNGRPTTGKSGGFMWSQLHQQSRSTSRSSRRLMESGATNPFGRCNFRERWKFTPTQLWLFGRPKKCTKSWERSLSS